MKINNITTKAKKFAFDGCHKIYLLESRKDEAEARDTGYSILPINELETAYEGSCDLRFINNWSLNKSFVAQFEEAEFA